MLIPKPKPKTLNLVFEGEIVTTIRDGGTLNYDGLYISPARSGWRYGDYELVEAPAPPEPEPPTPEYLRTQMQALTPRQFRDALVDADIMPDDVTNAISQIPDEKQRAKALNAWEYPTKFTRTDPLINQIGSMFSLTPEQIDDMWLGALNENNS